jgi:predicted ATP-grasp superfamily ATP-dependent carboligase
MLLAGGLGVHLPRYCVSADPAVLLDQAQSWGFPVVLKAENTCGGHGVTIARTADELRAAIAELRDGSLKRRVRRALGELFWSMAGLNDTVSAPPLLQSFMPGIPAMRTVSAWQGEVLDGVSFVAERIHPAPTGPSTVVRFVENAEMAETARRIVAALGCSGFVSFDFMLDETTGRAALIEANPRPIGTTHLAALYGHDACAPLLARLADQPVPVQPEIAGPPLIALFPKEIERDPQNLSRLHAAPLHLDVPSGEPAVMALYLRRLGQIHPGRMAEIVEAVGPGTRLRPESHPVWPPRVFEEAFSRSP